MTAMFVNLVLVLCVCDCFGFLDGKQLHPVNQPRQWQDLAAFVFQKIEGMERLLAEKDERVDKLESKIASHERAILQKDIVIDRLVSRVSDLETTVMLTPITEKHESRHNAKSDIDLPISNVDISDQFLSPINNTTIQRKTDVSQLSDLKRHENQLHQKTTPLFRSGGKKIADSKQGAMETSSSQTDDFQQHSEENHLLHQTKNEEDDNMSEAKISKSRQNRVAEPSAKPTVAFHAAISGNKAYAEDAIIVYDHETLDHGNGYNPSDGLYSVPEAGTYVLTWTILGGTREEFQTVLLVNGAIRGASFSDSSDVGDFHQSTAVVVLSLNQGDHVFIRMGSIVGHWTIISTDHSYGLSTFSGWKLD